MLLMKDIIREGHPTLAQRSLEVSIPLDDKTKKILKDMIEFLENSQNPEISEELGIRPGVGLAAPQINVKLRMIAVFTTDEKNEILYKMLLVNPKIISHSEAKTYIFGGEGCLSVDREVEGVVARHKKITVRAHQYLPETDELKKIELRVSGYLSVVIQHEIDHINGVLFVDKLVENLDDIEPVQFIIEEDTEENMEEIE